MRAATTGLVAALLVAGIVGCSDKKAKKSAGGGGANKPSNGLDLSYITSDFIGAQIIHPKRFFDSPMLKDLPPPKALLATMIEQFGVDPRKLEQVIILIDADLEPHTRISSAFRKAARASARLPVLRYNSPMLL